MTTYSHTLKLSDSQRIAMEAALTLMIEHCDEQLAAGPRAPYLALKGSCQEIWRTLAASTPTMTSTTLCPPLNGVAEWPTPRREHDSSP